MEPKARLRLVEEGDLSFLKEMRSDPVVVESLCTFALLNDARQKKWFESLQGDSSKCYLIFEILADTQWNKVGMARITEIDPVNRSACVGADIHVDYRGKGLARELYKKIFELCFSYYNLHRVWLLVLDTNHTALHLYKSLGFVEEGRQREAILRHGKCHDYIMMSFIPFPRNS